MNTNFSPFLSQVQQCRQTMRKLRKKIYKNCRNTHYLTKRAKENTEEIIEIFESRKIPNFITQMLKKRRSFDIKSLKNISVTSYLPLQDIKSRRYYQEKEVQNLFKEHKQRLQELKKKQQQTKIFGQVMQQMSSNNIFSSTNEDQIFQVQLQPRSQSSKEVDVCFQGNKQLDSQEKKYFEFNLNEDSMHQGLGFLNF